MDETMARLMEQLRGNPAMLQSLMRSRDGQALLQRLTQGDQGASLQRAAQSAARGNPAELMGLINQITQSPDGAELMERINKAVKK